MKKFIDKDKGGNLNHGVEFFAVGLVVSEYLDNKSGKDIVVEFIDPWGNLHTEWRSVDEVVITEIDDADAYMLKEAFESAIKRQNP